MRRASLRRASVLSTALRSLSPKLGDGSLFFMDAESGVEFRVVSEFVFIVRKSLNVDRSSRRHADAIDHDLNHTRHLPFNLQIDRRASGWNQSQP